MNSADDLKRAWRYVEGFDVPVLTDEKRTDWRGVIDKLTVAEFQRGARTARTVRRPDQLHLRPSPEAFMGYATAESGSAQYAEISDLRREFPDLTPEELAAADEARREIHQKFEHLIPNRRKGQTGVPVSPKETT